MLIGLASSSYIGTKPAHPNCLGSSRHQSDDRNCSVEVTRNCHLLQQHNRVGALGTLPTAAASPVLMTSPGVAPLSDSLDEALTTMSAPAGPCTNRCLFISGDVSTAGRPLDSLLVPSTRLIVQLLVFSSKLHHAALAGGSLFGRLSYRPHPLRRLSLWAHARGSPRDPHPHTTTVSPGSPDRRGREHVPR